MVFWGLVPARGGSKSIPHKNLVPVAGKPLLDYVVEAGRNSGALARIVCSTDDPMIAAHASKLGIAVDDRPAELATDEARVDNVAREFLSRARSRGEALPDAVVLLQPTSPLLRAEDVCALTQFMVARPQARSVHNAYPVPHNVHSWNQRLLRDDGLVEFPFEAERQRSRNKQEKPKLYAFGNLIAARTEALLSGDGFYAKPAHALAIDPRFAFDLDQQSDVALAEAFLATEKPA
jgi:CMP-N-acetylneuraminic acid synthetase